jgi:ApaG protein
MIFTPNALRGMLLLGSISELEAFAPRAIGWGRAVETWSTDLSMRLPTSTSSQLFSGFLGQDDFSSSNDSSDTFDDDDESFGLDTVGKEYKQTMTPAERKENLAVIRQIFKYDLKDLQNRRDYAGWVQARKDLKKRRASDPWFELNDKLKEAIQLDMPESILEKLRAQVKKVGGPPEGVVMKRDYAMADEIYELDMSLGRAEAIAEFEQRKRNNAKWQKMIAEREANERRQEEEDNNTNPYLKQEEEARKRREKTMRIIYGKVEEERKIKEEKAKEIQEKYGFDQRARDGGPDMSPLDQAIEAAKKSLEESKRAKGLGEFAKSAEDALATSSSDTASSSSDTEAEASKTSKGGRPRMPGDMDITRGEMENGDANIQDWSEISSNNVKVKVTTSYNAAQSDPPMRKHCFAYTIQITNLSATETIQLVSRKFEIQTVGARQKDVVEGQGVTGRQPILKPGETFEYTSTAPLSVRPLGTTIVAARMKGAYEFNVVEVDPAGAKDAEGNPKVKILTEAPKTAELGMFHFVFPESQRVKPVQTTEDDDEDDDEDEAPTPAAATAASTATTPAAPAPAPAGAPSLPGDDDMKTGVIIGEVNDQSDTITEGVSVKVTSQYREERSDPKMDKHCFAYNIRITNENKDYAIQLTGRKFEIQTIGSSHKDVVAGPGVTGRQPVLQPGESFEYTSTAPLSVRPLGTTPVVARMQGEYSFVRMGDAYKGEAARQAKLGKFHFVLPALDIA